MTNAKGVLLQKFKNLDFKVTVKRNQYLSKAYTPQYLVQMITRKISSFLVCFNTVIVCYQRWVLYYL